MLQRSLNKAKIVLTIAFSLQVYKILAGSDGLHIVS